MKKTILLLIACFTTVVLSAADNKEKASALTKNIEKELGLNEEQKTKVYNLLLSKFEAIEGYSKKAVLTEQEKNALMIEKRKFITEIRAILTEEQYKKWHGLRNEQLQKMKNGENVENPVIDKELELMLHNK